MKIRVAVVGAGGRLGAVAARAVEASAQFELVARVERGMELVAELQSSRAELALDATEAGLGARHARLMLENGVRPVIGTSGVSPSEAQSLNQLAVERGLGGLIVPNFSLGIVLLEQAAREAARHYAACELIEMHHERKKDAPSGTALHLWRELAAVRGGAEIPIHSVRLPGLYAHQLAIFGAPGETYTLRHDMSGPEGFAPGILAALRHARTARGIAVGLVHAL
jgi:4-hydroxy-tetrahydrodipicolinate reductase